MKKEKILVIGALGRLGVELLAALRSTYGEEAVIAADLHEPTPALTANGPYLSLDALNMTQLESVLKRFHISQVYLLAAMLSATGEKYPAKAWDLNMQSLLNVLHCAQKQKIHRVFWPSSIAVFGSSSPKENCPQHTTIQPETVYGISKLAGEQWCQYYFLKHGVDVRSIRYPGLISHSAPPGGGTTDYAVDIFHQALQAEHYTCFLQSGTRLPMMYMPDAIRATLELMEAPAAKVRVRTAYNLAAMSFTPAELARAIKNYIPAFDITYQPDARQLIADAWPGSIDDTAAQADWGWEPAYGLSAMVREMLQHLAPRYPAAANTSRNTLLTPAAFC